MNAATPLTPYEHENRREGPTGARPGDRWVRISSSSTALFHRPHCHHVKNRKLGPVGDGPAQLLVSEAQLRGLVQASCCR